MVSNSFFETIMDTTTDYLYSYYYCLVLQTIDELQQQQDPPYRRGVHFEEMRLHFSKYRFSTNIFKEVIVIVFARMARLDAFFADRHFSFFSRVRLPGYFTFSENMETKYPGFRLNDSTGFIESASMPEINLDTLFALLRSRDLK
jgi:hypothetical protein